LNKYEILANSYFNLTIDNESLSRDLDFLKREMRRSSFNKSIDENYKSIISKQGNLNLTLV
jgi:hypothetical protein